MRAKRIIGITTILSGIAATLVGVLHFLRTEHLDRWISSQLDVKAAERILPIFHINHTGTGVFLILLGAVLTLAGYSGLLKGKRWGAAVASLIGAGLATLAVVLWATAPPLFLEAVAFRVALLTLAAVGILTALPPLLFWNQFGEA